MYKEVFQLRLAARRKELGLTQYGVSTDTEINQTNISKYETGKLEPNLETLGILAEHYQVSIDWLLGNQHNGKEGNLIKVAINEFYEEVRDLISWAAYQKHITEEAADILYDNLLDIKEKKDKEGAQG